MTGEILNMIQDIMADLTIGLVIIALYYVLGCLKNWTIKVKAQTEGIKDENFKNLVGTALTRLEGLAEVTVAGIEGKIAKELREQVKLGNIDKSELDQLAKQALSQIVDALEPQYEVVLRESIGDLDSYIGNLIEAKLEQIKVGNTGGGKS